MLRWVLVAFTTDPVLLTVLQLLHAVTFSVTYMGMIGYVVETVDERRVASAQGLYISIFGVFSAVLTFAVGRAFDHYAGHSFLLSAVLPMMALVVLGLHGVFSGGGTES